MWVTMWKIAWVNWRFLIFGQWLISLFLEKQLYCSYPSFLSPNWQVAADQSSPWHLLSISSWPRGRPLCVLLCLILKCLETHIPYGKLEHVPTHFPWTKKNMETQMRGLSQLKLAILLCPSGRKLDSTDLRLTPRTPKLQFHHISTHNICLQSQGFEAHQTCSLGKPPGVLVLMRGSC